MKRKLLNILIGLIFLLVSSVSATNYYLDPVNGSMGNDGSSENPWKDLKMVMLYKTFQNGDTLFLRSGFHGFNFGISGFHSAPVVIKADEGHNPYMLKVTMLGSNWVLDGILFTPEWNRGYETPGNFENGTLLSFDEYSHDNIIKNCEFRSVENSRNWSIQNWRDSVWSGVKDYGTNNIIQNNHFKNVAYAITAQEQSEGTLISHNFIEIYSGDGIRNAGANNTTIEYNTVCNAVELDSDPYVGNHEDGIQGWGDSNGLIVRGNYVYSDTGIDTIPFIGPIQGIVIFDGSTTNALFENNVVITDHWHGITVLGSYNSKYINNTVLPVPNINNTQGPPWIRVDKKKDGTSSSGNIVRNNLTTDFVIESGSSIVDHNVEDASAPSFVNDYNNWDFTPKPGFSLNGKAIIDTGSPDGAPDRDIIGVPRPQGEGFDIGAYEYNTHTVIRHSFYLDPINGSMNNDGSPEHPWSTLKDAIQEDRFSDGDTLILRTGYHGSDILLSKNIRDSLLIIAEEGAKPTLLTVLVGSSNWIIDGLNFTQMGTDDVGNPGNFDNGKFLQFGVESSNNIVRNCKFYSTIDASAWTVQNWRDSVWSGVLDAGRNNIIRDNNFTNIAYAVETTPDCDASLIEGNTINHFSGDGIRIGSSDNCTVQYNVIKNQVELDADPIVGNHEDGIQAWNYGDGVDNLVIRGNYILNYEDVNQPLKGILQGIGLFDGFYNNCIIENNVVIVEHWHGISMYGAKDSKIINNTVLPNPGGSRDAGPPWIMINNHKDGTPSSGNIVRNNLATDSDIKSGSAVVDHNVFSADAIDFVNDYNNFDFTPKPGYTNPADIAIIDAGSEEDAPLIDILGVTRPQGKAFDIGAYEWVDTTVTVNDELDLSIDTFELFNNYPNPFNPTTIIKYSLAENSKVKLIVYNSLGEVVKTLVNKNQSSGIYSISFNAKGLSSGIYFYRLTANKFNKTKKMLLLR